MVVIVAMIIALSGPVSEIEGVEPDENHLKQGATVIAGVRDGKMQPVTSERRRSDSIPEPRIASPVIVHLNGYAGSLIRLTPVMDGNTKSLSVDLFWAGPFADEARRLTDAAVPASLINITNYVFDDKSPWHILPQLRCGENADCTPPVHSIFHLVTAKPEWCARDISVRSAGEIARDFPAQRGEPGAKVSFEITKGPTSSVVEGYFTKGFGSIRGFILEFDIVEPSTFSLAVLTNIEIAMDYAATAWRR